MHPYPKRLIEVDLPVRRVSDQAQREKSIRQGHLSTLHVWWARRPLAACRAVILASLWPDPADDRCPDSFRDSARSHLRAFANEALGKLGGASQKRFVGIQKDPDFLNDNGVLREALLDFIAEFADWARATEPAYLKLAQALTRSAHEALGGAPESRPLVIDPFAGGGAMPLEALRVGADAFASDLNPLAVLLNRVVLEYVPGHGQKLAEGMKHWAERVQEEAFKDLAAYYPKDPDGSVPIAYLWARTIKCEGPGCGKPIPLTRTFWLTKRTSGSVAIKADFPQDSSSPRFEIVTNPKAAAIPAPTVKRGSAVCPWCAFVTPVQSVRTQLAAQRGGANNATLLAVVCRRPTGERSYRAPTSLDYEAVEAAGRAFEQMPAIGNLPPVPNEPLPPKGTLGFRVQNYGMQTFGDLHTHRQAITLVTLCRHIRRAEAQSESVPIGALLALALGRLQDLNSSLCTWADTVVGANRAQSRVSMVWDFVEASPLVGAGGSWENQVDWILRVIDHVARSIPRKGTVTQSPAQEHPLPDDSANLLATDPPYYDAFGYADLSDLFLVWLKRAVSDPGSLFGLKRPGDKSPKELEIVVNPSAEADGRGPKDHKWFSEQMRRSFEEARRVIQPSGIGVVVFAHKDTRSWEALLEGVVAAGWVVTASWPLDTERPSRQRAQGSAALNSSVHLVCRPRENQDGSVRDNNVGDWREALHELPERIHSWLPRLAQEGIVGADAIFACLGPALEIFSRYARVEKASGEQVTLKEYLEHVWSAVSKEALSMIFEGADTTGFEPDSRLTAMWLWTLAAGHTNGGSEEPTDAQDSTEDEEDGSAKKEKLSGFYLEYDAARKIAQGLGAHLEDLKSLVEVKGDTARLLPVGERTKSLFGKDEAEGPRSSGKKKGSTSQLKLGFEAELAEVEEEQAWGVTGAPQAGQTVLDRVHQAMILFAAGRTAALQRFLVDDGAGRDERFWRLAQALSALYPAATDERRWVEGLLARRKALRGL